MLRGLALCLIFFFFHPDILLLKNGGRIEGRILKEDETGIVILTSAGTLTFPKTKVEKVVRCPWVVDEFDDKWEKIDKKDISALKDLLDWCLAPERKMKLKVQARKVARRIVRVEKDNGKARKVLGQVKIDGKWVSRKRAGQIRKKKALEREKERRKGKEEARRRAEGKSMLALIGGVPISRQIEENARADKKEEEEIADECGLEYTVRSSRRISIKGMIDPEKAKQFLELGERMCGTLNKELGLPAASSPFRSGKDGKLNFFIIKREDLPDILNYINGRYTTYSEDFIKFAIRYKGGVAADGNGCVGVQIHGIGHDEDVFCHYFGHAYIESLGGNVGHWFTEGFAIYCSIRFHGNAKHFCTTLGKYAMHFDRADKETSPIIVTFKELQEKDLFPPVVSLFKKHMNRLDVKDLAKSWGTVKLFMSDKWRPSFLKYLKELPYYKRNKHKNAMEKIYHWTPEKLDDLVKALKVD